MFAKAKQSPFIRFMASPRLTAVCLLILAILTVWGTVYQAEHGLYAAKQKFFQSWVFFIFKFIPFPGTILVLFIACVNLVFALLFRIGLRLRNMGNLLTHLGIMILLVGGFLTFLYAEESVLELKEGEGSRFSTAYYEWELAVWRPEALPRTVYAVDTKNFTADRGLEFPDLGLALTIEAYYKNCTALPGGTSGLRVLKEQPVSTEPAENIPGVMFRIVDKGVEEKILLTGQDNAPTRVQTADGSYLFSLRKKRYLLPALLKLIDFKREFYPGSDIPKSFESLVQVTAGELEREVRISMNRPLRYKGYTLYQSSYYIAQNGDEYSILAVVKNFGRLLPYVASIIIFLGMLIHFLVMLMRKGKNKSVKIILVCLIMVGLGRGYAEAAEPSAFPLDHFKKIVILENGRKKPLDTFAQNVLKQLSGRSTFEKKPAILWLSRVLLAPQQSYDDKVFMVNNPEVLNAVGLEVTGKERDRYSYRQLKDHFQKLRRLAMAASRVDGEKRTSVANEIIMLFNKLYIYQKLITVFDFAVPHEDFIIADPELKVQLGLPAETNIFSPFDLVQRGTILEAERLQPEVSALMAALNRRFSLYADQPLTILPAGASGQEKWFSPGELLAYSFNHRTPVPRELHHLNDMVRAYLVGDEDRFAAAVENFNRLILNRPGMNLSKTRIQREIFYNGLDPFYKSEFFYGFSLLFLLCSLLIFKKWLYRISILLLAAGFLFHGVGIILRILISGRPPVTNLYETFVFTGWIAVLLGVILELFRKKNIGLLTGSLSGLLMLLIAGKYALEGDTMGMLVAVLDSNFWLATHVITITVGYGGIVISGLIGHLYVLQKIFKPASEELQQNTFQAVYATQAFGLIFTFIGTVLGGIWADQSWGRFWGWDPKENGALLIILWSAMLFHARLAKMIREVGFSLGSIVGIISVVLAWFGVNLLGVGLHSYGFTSGVATSLVVYIIVELVFIFGAYIYLKKAKLA